MPAAKKAAPKVTPAIKTALERWLKGEKRPVLVKELNLKMSAGKLAAAFRQATGKTWKELKAQRTKPSARKAKASPKAAPAAKEEHTSRRKAA